MKGADLNKLCGDLFLENQEFVTVCLTPKYVTLSIHPQTSGTDIACDHHGSPSDL
jgi:hypothetical protein